MVCCRAALRRPPWEHGCPCAGILVPLVLAAGGDGPGRLIARPCVHLPASRGWVRPLINIRSGVVLLPTWSRQPGEVVTSGPGPCWLRARLWLRVGPCWPPLSDCCTPWSRTATVGLLWPPPCEGGVWGAFKVMSAGPWCGSAPWLGSNQSSRVTCRVRSGCLTGSETGSRVLRKTLWG